MSTQIPLSYLDPISSAVGQVALSTGPNSPPVWGQLPFSALSGIPTPVTETFYLGTDFNTGATSITLAGAYGSVNNIKVHFNGVYQSIKQVASLIGRTLTFTSPIPAGVTSIYVDALGVATITATPPANSVGVAQFSQDALNYFALASTANVTQSGSSALTRTVSNKVAETLSVTDYAGVDPTGATDSTAGLQNAITNARSQGGNSINLRWRAGTYAISSSLVLGSNQWIEFDPGVVINFTPPTNLIVTTSLFVCSGQSNVFLDGHGATINGTRAVVSSTGLGIAFYFYGVNNYHIKNFNINNFSTDGISLTGDNTGSGACKNGVIENVKVNNSGRNGLSIISAINLNIIGGSYTNSNGSSSGPWAGIDIEPNANCFIQNVNLNGVYTSGNAGPGIQLVPQALSNNGSASNIYEVNIVGGKSVNDGSYAANNKASLCFVNGSAFVNRVYGQINVTDYVIDSPTGAGVTWYNWDATLAPITRLTRVGVYDPDYTLNAPSNSGRTGFNIYCDSGQSVNTLGNIVMNHCAAYDRRATARMSWGIALRVDSGKGLANINITDSFSSNFVAAEKAHVSTQASSVAGGMVNCNVSYTNPTSFTLSASANLNDFVGQRVIAGASSINFTLPTAANCQGSFFEVMTPVGNGSVQVLPQASDTINWYGGAASTGVVLDAGGALIRVRSLGGTGWLVENVAGEVRRSGTSLAAYVSYTTAIPTYSGNNGDIAYNIAPTAGAPSGWQYNGTAWIPMAPAGFQQSGTGNTFLTNASPTVASGPLSLNAGVNNSIQGTQSGYLRIVGGTVSGSDPALTLYGSTYSSNPGLATLDSSSLRIRSASGAEWARFAPTTGNLLIGTTTDNGTSKLQVSGNASFSTATVGNGLSLTGPATLGVTNNGVFDYESPNYRFYIGDGTGYSFRLSKRVSSTTTDQFIFNDNGTATFAGNLTAPTFIGSGASLTGLAASQIAFTQTGTGAVGQSVNTKLQQMVSVLDFAGVDPTGTTDSTAGLQAALNSSTSIDLGVGTYKFTSLTIPSRGTRLIGRGQHTVLIQTGTGAAFTCADSTAGVYPTSFGAYVNDGQFTISDFSLYVSGTIGFDLSKTRSSGSTIARIYMKPTTYLVSGTASGYVAGTAAFSIDNNPWGASYATYAIAIRDCWPRGFQNVVVLNQVVNVFTMENIYAIENLNFATLSGVSGASNGVSQINFVNCYHESSQPAARGIVFGAGGGSYVNIENMGFELTNAAATQYAYDFTAGGTWTQVTVTNAKYLIQGDGNALNNRRVVGTIPVDFTEYGRNYTSSTYGNVPMLWVPGATPTTPYQMPSTIRLGGLGSGVGTILLGRADVDSKDSSIGVDIYGNVYTNAYGNWSLNNQTGSTTFLSFNAATPALTPGVTNNTSLGTSSLAWSSLYATAVNAATGTYSGAVTASKLTVTGNMVAPGGAVFGTSTPGTWTGGSYHAVQIDGSAFAVTGNVVPVIAANYYNNGSDLYSTAAPASRSYQNAGVHYWSSAPSGAANAAVSWTPLMNLSSSGLSVQVPVTATSFTGSGAGLTGLASPQISFTQAGTGAQAQTLTTKLNQQVSVFDFMTAAQIADVQGQTLLVDVTASIQSAINSVSVAGGTVFFPTGWYSITAELLISNPGVNLVGASKTGTMLYKRFNNGSLLHFQNSNWSNVRSIFLQGIQDTTGTGNLVYLEGSSYCSINDCKIFNAIGYGISISQGSQSNGAYFNKIDSCHLFNNTLANIYSGNNSSNTVVIGGEITSSTNYGWLVVGGNACTAYGASFEGNTVAGVCVGSATVTGDVSLFGCRMEGAGVMKYGAVIYNALSTFQAFGCHITSCTAADIYNPNSANVNWNQAYGSTSPSAAVGITNLSNTHTLATATISNSSGNTIFSGVSSTIIKSLSNGLSLSSANGTLYLATGTNTLNFQTTGALLIANSIAPNGNYTAPVGSIYMNTGGSAGTTLYTKETGTGNTGWVGLPSVNSNNVWAGTNTFSIAPTLAGTNITGMTAPQIGFTQAGTGAKSQTVNSKLQQVVSITDFSGVDPTGATDSTTGIQNALNALGNNVSIYFPAGTYLVTSTITISNQRVTLIGAGIYATQILFAPTAAGTCISVSAGSSVIYQGTITGISFFSNDSTYKKTAINISDASNYTVSNISISGSVSVNGASYWSGAGSVGINIAGRELGDYSKLYIAADNPLTISQNPNSTISIDHHHFQDLYLLANANPCVTIATGVNLTQVKFDGNQAWVRGTYGLYWNDTTSSIVSTGLSINNVRTEQGTSTSAYQFYINRNYALQEVSFNQCYGGIDRNGYYFNNVVNATLDSCYYATTTAQSGITATAPTAGTLNINNTVFSAGSTLALTGYTQVSSDPKYVSGSPVAVNARYIYQSNTIADYPTVNGVKTRQFSGTIANGAQFDFMCGANQGVTTAQVTVSVQGPTKNEGGIAFANSVSGAGTAYLIAGTANFGVGNVSGKLTLFCTTSKTVLFNQLGETVTFVATVVCL